MTTSSVLTGDGGLEARLETLLERYCDGDLAGDELTWFERRLRDDESLRAQVRLQERIDASLRRTHAPDPIAMPAIPISVAARLARGADACPAAEGAAVTSGASRRGGARRTWGMLAAAVLLLGVASVFRLYWDRRVPDFNLMRPGEMYERLVMTGFQPAVVCRTDPEFAALVKERLGTALVATAAAGVEVLGWGYNDDYNGSPISPDTMMLLARVDERQVLVLLDRTSRDRELVVPPGGSVRLFRREIGPIVTYEITPLDQPRVITILRQP